jgi:hypothetical protein
MTTARGRLVDPAVTRWYHCLNKCVRFAHLLDSNGPTNRKAWLQNRLKELSEIFAIAVGGFSILDNHLHVLVRLDPEIEKTWSDEEVARRWGMLYPPRNRRREIIPISQEWIQQQLEDRDWIAKTREQLQSLSWFMKCLKEPLARLANAEDDCAGAFFCGRFKSIAILDEQALLEVCVYIDLNPLAAGITFLPEESPYTSITERVEHAWPKMSRADLQAALRGLTIENLPAGDVEQSHWLCPLDDRRGQGAAREGMLAGFTLPKYLLLLDHTARIFREGKAVLDANAVPIFDRLGTTADVWEARLMQLKAKFLCRKLTGRVLATTREVLSVAAEKLGVHHLVNLATRDHFSPQPRPAPTG